MNLARPASSDGGRATTKVGGQSTSRLTDASVGEFLAASGACSPRPSNTWREHEIRRGSLTPLRRVGRLQKSRSRRRGIDEPADRGGGARTGGP
jgi:hypothetical protein